MKTFGVSWDSKKNILTLLMSRIPSDVALTKHNVSRNIAAIFDPLRFISPYIMVAEVILVNSGLVVMNGMTQLKMKSLTG